LTNKGKQTQELERGTKKNCMREMNRPQGWMDGWMDGWMGLNRVDIHVSSWMDGWIGVGLGCSGISKVMKKLKLIGSICKRIPYFVHYQELKSMTYIILSMSVCRRSNPAFHIPILQ